MYNIALICDKGYYLPTLITLRSIKKNRSQKGKYRVYVILDFYDDRKEQKLKAEENGEDFCVEVLHSKCEINVEEKGYVSAMACTKFILPSILSDIDEVLYIDGDVLVRQGFEDVFLEDLEGYYAAVVKDMCVYVVRENYRENLQCPDYFNSGVLYLNLKKMREDNMPTQLIKTTENLEDTELLDQDGFNICFRNKVKFIHPKYNFLYQLLYQVDDEAIQKFYQLDAFERDKMVEKIPILHISGRAKPWNCKGMFAWEEWFSYIRDFEEYAICEKNYYERSVTGLKFGEGDVINQIYGMKGKRMRPFPYGQVKKNKRVVIYGAGKRGRDYVNQLLSIGYCREIKWVDTNYKDIAEDPIEILSPETIQNQDVDIVVIAIADKKEREEVRQYLLTRGVEEWKITWAEK